ncbi:MAG TPA: CBS domain-containing protein [Minicystis sp.]|nr:CBS domain-containing protein [Minicystis sp.]
MAVFVREIMNEELYAIGLDENVADAASAIVALEITAAPVLDAARRPVAMVSLRDLLNAQQDAPARSAATTPVATVDADETIANAAHKMGVTGEHRLVVVDEEGRAIGVVSALDVVRGLLGVPVTHPRAFPHFDVAAGVSWTDDAPLDLVHAHEAPNGPGVLALVFGRAGSPERITWAEACDNVQTRLHALLRDPRALAPSLARGIAAGHLRFRAAFVPDPDERERVLGIVLGRAMAELQPHETGLA